MDVKSQQDVDREKLTARKWFMSRIIVIFTVILLYTAPTHPISITARAVPMTARILYEILHTEQALGSTNSSPRTLVAMYKCGCMHQFFETQLFFANTAWINIKSIAVPVVDIWTVDPSTDAPKNDINGDTGTDMSDAVTAFAELGAPLIDAFTNTNINSSDSDEVTQAADGFVGSFMCSFTSSFPVIWAQMKQHIEWIVVIPLVCACLQFFDTIVHSVNQGYMSIALSLVFNNGAKVFLPFLFLDYNHEYSFLLWLCLGGFALCMIADYHFTTKIGSDKAQYSGRTWKEDGFYKLTST